MAKDPAFLFYPGDWMGGTMTMSRHLKGCYMDLLIAQFNSGPLSLDQIKTLLGQDQASWTVLREKFKREVNSAGGEVFFNERLVTEIEKRKRFIEKQSLNGSKGGRPPNKPKNNLWVNPNKSLLENENEIKNKNEDFKDGGMGEGFFINELPMESELTKGEIINVQDFISVTCDNKKLSEEQVKERWKAFKIDNFKKREWYGSREKLLSHFRHSLKNELNKKNGITVSKNRQQSQAAAIANLIKTGQDEFAAAREKNS